MIHPRVLSVLLALTAAGMFLLCGFIRMWLGEPVPGWYRWMCLTYLIPAAAFLMNLPQSLRQER
ncbi:MAG TPA: hypothetical protein VD997_08805 [Phycisphaerales bacterium]|nr:hypothetical protein [Phycisphaerales bacterium]